MGQVTQTLTWRTEVGAVWRSLENHIITQVRNYDYTGKLILYEWCSHIEDPPGWSSAGATLATGGQTCASRRTRRLNCNTTEYNKANTQLKIMQWNAERVIRKKTKLEHILKKENIDICYTQ